MDLNRSYFISFITGFWAHLVVVSDFRSLGGFFRWISSHKGLKVGCFFHVILLFSLVGDFFKLRIVINGGF